MNALAKYQLHQVVIRRMESNDVRSMAEPVERALRLATRASSCDGGGGGWSSPRVWAMT